MQEDLFVRIEAALEDISNDLEKRKSKLTHSWYQLRNLFNEKWKAVLDFGCFFPVVSIVSDEKIT